MNVDFAEGMGKHHEGALSAGKANCLWLYFFHYECILMGRYCAAKKRQKEE